MTPVSVRAVPGSTLKRLRWSTPLTQTSTWCSGTVRGTSMCRRASPPVTWCGALETTRTENLSLAGLSSDLVNAVDGSRPKATASKNSRAGKIARRTLISLSFPRSRRGNKKAAPPRATLTTVALGSPAFLERIRSGPATFCPYLKVGLATRCSTFQAIRPSNWRSDRPICRFMKIPKVCAKTFRAIRLVKCQTSRARIFSK